MSGQGWGQWYDAETAADAARRAQAGAGTAADARILADLFAHAARKGPDDERARAAAEERAEQLDQEINEVAARLADYLQGHQFVLADLPLSIRRKISAYKHQTNRALNRAPWLQGQDEYGPLPEVPVVERERGREVVVIDI